MVEALKTKSRLQKKMDSGVACANAKVDSESATAFTQPEEFKGKFDTPIAIYKQAGQKPQVVWINENTFVGNFEENQGIGQIIENLGPSQRMVTPEEAPFIYSKFPHMSRVNPTYFADKDGIYLSTQSSVAAKKLKPSYIVTEPSMTKLDPETIDSRRHNPGHRVPLVGVPSK